MVHKLSNKARSQGHNSHGDHHRKHHDEDVIDHTNGSDNGIEREDGVQHHDLQDHQIHGRACSFTDRELLIKALKFGVQFVGGLIEQEETTNHHHNISSCHSKRANGKERFRHIDDERDKGEQQETDN